MHDPTTRSEPSDAAAVPPPPAFVLPGGRAFDPGRSRWAGPLDAEELTFCRARGIPVVYDCLQNGWVPAACRDEDASPAAVAPAAVPVTPEQAATELVAAVRRRARAEAAALPAGPGNAAAARQRVRASIAAALTAFRAEHGLRAADGCHLASEAILHQELPRSPRSLAAGMQFSFRAWRPEDVPVYRALLDDPQLWEFLPEPYPAPLTEEMARVLIEVGSVDQKQEALAVVLDGRPIGQCLLRFAEPFAGVRTAEVAYWLGREHQGRGWMAPILCAFLQQAFRAHALDAVVAWIREDHAASAKVAERCGFARDPFPFEAELAAATKRQRFVRYATYRSAWSEEIAEPPPRAVPA
jgi:RimJ/RimL family protein N-acetyltransferase